MSVQTTLLTSHKGVDLHAATALRVMRDRLAGGERLAALHRCEMHTFVGQPAGVSIERLLDIGRYYNPNKHHYGCFRLTDPEPWDTAETLAAAWPGDAAGSDLGLDDAGELYARLLGGPLPAGRTAVDVASWSRDQDGPVLSGVLWRLVVTGDRSDAGQVGEKLAVARGRKEGLLLNPHMERWLTVVR
jgi:hypothetical protein